jgi:hypothetical protein
MEFMPETLGGVLERLLIENMRMKHVRMSSLMGQLASALDYLELIQLMHLLICMRHFCLFLN